jgi:hypothetical protein
MNQPTILQEPPDFSLVLGGPLFQLYRRTHLSGSDLELVHRRIIVITLVTWLPLLILSLLDGHLLGGVTLPFLRDIEIQVRFLIALPVLIAAELVVNSRLRPAVQNFVNENIVGAEEMPKFRTAIDSATRLRNSIPLELGLLIIVFTGGHWLWQSQITLGTPSWYAIPGDVHMQPTPAGQWNTYVSIPIFQFILLRWYFRLLIWFRFLWQVSRLKLQLIPTHPDRSAGLAFLGGISYAFAPILFAEGAMLSGMIANRVLYGGESLRSFKMPVLGLIVLFTLLILGPLTMFTPQLARARRKGLADYGSLASCYVEEFQEKWVMKRVTQRNELLGTSDIQSLADLGNSYSMVREMRFVPFGLEEMSRLAAVIAVPLVPLCLTVFSLEELVMRLIRIIF